MFNKAMDGLVMGAFLGFLAGPLLLTAGTCLYYFLFSPDFFKDGQWGLIFFATIPYGFLLGAILGAVAGGTIAIIGSKSK